MSDDRNRLVTVCKKCLTASCWHYIFVCDEYRRAGSVDKTVAELNALAVEDPSNYSVAVIAKRTGIILHRYREDLPAPPSSSSSPSSDTLSSPPHQGS